MLDFSAIWSKNLFSLFKTKKYPIRVPREKHAISKGDIEEGVLDILYRLRRNSYDSYLVGGCIRDILLGKEAKDFDIVTNARPRQVKRLFRRCFIIGKRFRLAHVYIDKDRFIEVATFRASVDPESEEGMRYGTNNVFGSIEEDAKRRDFTVNALYFDSKDSAIIDYTGGMADLNKKVLRSIGDPAERYQEDPVRIIRAARFCSKLNLKPSKKDFIALKENSHHIEHSNSSRLLEELYKIFKCGASAEAFYNLQSYGLLECWIPELKDFSRSKPLYKRLEYVDNHRAKGVELTNAQYLSLLFFDVMWQKIVDNPVANNLQESTLILKNTFREMAIRLRMPKGVWEEVCGTIARQKILIETANGLMKRKNENRFIRNPHFVESLNFYTMLVQAGEGDPEKLTYWRKRLNELKLEDNKRHNDNDFSSKKKTSSKTGLKASSSKKNVSKKKTAKPQSKS
jgi:poly(A) polymerase